MMVKLVNIEAFGVKYESYILIENFKDLEAYYENFRKRQIYDANDELHENKKLNLQLSSYAYYSYKIKTGEYNNIRSIRFLIDVMGDVYKEQLRLVLDGKKLAINMKGGYFSLPSNAVINNIRLQHNKIFKSKFDSN